MTGVAAARGVLLVFTGDGKGKTTSALGLGLRALGQGLAVAVIQFVKGKDDCGEHLATQKFRLPWSFHQPGSPGFVAASAPDTAVRQGLAAAWSQAAASLANPELDLVILDEVNLALEREWIPFSCLEEALLSRPPTQHVVCTGRRAPARLCELADTVTRFQAEKHHLQQGIRAQPGMEF